MTIIEFSDWLQKELDQRGWAGNKLAVVASIDASIINRAIKGAPPHRHSFTHRLTARIIRKTKSPR